MTLEPFFRIYVKFHDFSMAFSLFCNTKSILRLLPSGGPIRDAPSLKTNYITIFFCRIRLINGYHSWLHQSLKRGSLLPNKWLSMGEELIVVGVILGSSIAYLKKIEFFFGKLVNFVILAISGSNFINKVLDQSDKM